MSAEAQSQQQEIAPALVDNHNHHPQMSADELLKAIKGANGMPVLFVPSSDGRLAAVAVDGLPQNLVAQTNRENNKTSAEKNYRSWLLLLASLVATATFTAGLAPPGGFWAAADEKNGYVAGTAVMSDKFPVRYTIFYYSNTTAFFSSLMVIGMLAKNIYVNTWFFSLAVGTCFLSLGTSYIAGTCVSPRRAIYAIVVFVLGTWYVSAHQLWFYLRSIMFDGETTWTILPDS